MPKIQTPGRLSDLPPDDTRAASNSPYAGQFYYNKRVGDAIAVRLQEFIQRGHTGLVFSPSDWGKNIKTVRLLLNCATAWIQTHPHDYPSDVLALLGRGKFSAVGGKFYFIMRAEDNVPPKATNAVDFLATGHIPDNPLSITAPIKPNVITHEADYLAPGNTVDFTKVAEGATVVDEEEPQPQKSMPDFLPDDGDIDTLLINIDSWATDPNTPARAMFQRAGIKLSPESQNTVRAVATKHGCFARVEADKFKIVKP